jgi:hypothetical protein
MSEVWFGGDLKYWDRNSPHPDKTISGRWWSSPPGFDDMLRENYQETIEKIVATKKADATIDNILLLD